MRSLSIANYRVVRFVGSGAVGEVYEAVAEHLSCRVALKVLRPDTCHDSDAIERLCREARAANVIGHPGIVRALDYGRTGEGLAYLVLEYLEGESLRAQLQQGSVREKAVRVARQVASAMAVAHERGVVHRDLKPDNLFLVRDPEIPGGERVKVLDFGLAKLAPALLRDGDARFATQLGALLGTPAYMAPEQCRGLPDISAAVDVYSLGAVLFHMRAGEPPFGGAGVGELLAQHIYEPAPSLMSRDPLAAEGLATLVAAMLQKEPQARPSMREVADRLEWLGNPGVNSQPLPSAGSLTGGQYVLPAPRRPSRLLPALLAVLACVVGGMSYLGQRLWRKPSQPQIQPAVPAPALGIGEGTRAAVDLGVLDLVRHDAARAEAPARAESAGQGIDRRIDATVADGAGAEWPADASGSQRTGSTSKPRRRAKQELTNEEIDFVR